MFLFVISSDLHQMLQAQLTLLQLVPLKGKKLCNSLEQEGDFCSGCQNIIHYHSLVKSLSKWFLWTIDSCEPDSWEKLKVDAWTVVSPRFSTGCGLAKRCLTVKMLSCEDKLNKKTAHLWLPPIAQKCRLIKLPGNNPGQGAIFNFTKV